MGKDLLFEIGVEEMPARFVRPTLSQLKTLAQKELQDARLDFQDMATYCTPRRLCLYVKKLALEQQDETREVRGPAARAAFDADGKPTKAALGFARGQGISVEDLVLRETGNGQYVYAIVKDEGQPAGEILPRILSDLVKGLNFPKPMRWGELDFYFARPIHWLVALHGTEIISVEIAGIKSSNYTYGHPYLSKGSIPLTEAKDYFPSLAKHYVVVDQEQRKTMIKEQLKELAAGEGAQLTIHEELLEEVTQLLEYPTAFVGEFPPEYLALPEEVVVTPMTEHQRYFPLRDEEGKLLPKFLAVRNGDAQFIEVVREGNEKVLMARLNDASFFYKEDQKESLANKIEKLKEIVFQEQLGTLWEKTFRIQKLGVSIGKKMNWDQETIAQIQRAAYLSKGDLVTNMVHEFPELQGIMGGYYVQDTEEEGVALGIREHYLPRFSGDLVPSNPIGIAVSIADKIDTITGCFLAGLLPTGSQDPYGLRRQALGICHTILQHGLPLSLEELTVQSIDLYEDKFSKEEKEDVQETLLAFYKQRLENIFQEEKGFAYDVVRAVLEVDATNPTDGLARCQALGEFMQAETFGALNTVFTRAFNLAKNADSWIIDPSYLEEEEERELYERLKTVARLTEKYSATGDYTKILETLATLREPVDQFFDQVMVMVEDEKVKSNRLALLLNLVKEARRVADFSQITIKG